MVIPACPPTTGTSTSISLRFFFSATNVFALTTSSVVTPKSFFGSYTPFFFKTSAAIGTVELTGLLIMWMKASGQLSATASTKVFTMLALMLKRSSRVIPGFLGTPAGMTTTSTPFKELGNSAAPVKSRTCEGVLQ
ncbi:hypothetical protein OIU76_028129 [Salix suchowensis]|uniref:Uncharacterized protein n=2 Tax=Salix TaxID=40685 RepID=A0A9Q0UR61_SALPP|nr:hypothetical protein OIU78_026277 [Salix suchowensis]KAJ6369816.1 hypothetical protein OIU76_028129 [Salix suchowensis]KAJ6734889.1 hypothetical protein OIU79_002043 [Salix purpurea]KAJ6752997.1 hypothetical protein OIU74_027776 [Salix koriyanagi]